ncbi:MAG: hypothetical protein AAF799_09070 [Myxococcota bacterium]
MTIDFGSELEHRTPQGWVVPTKRYWEEIGFEFWPDFDENYHALYVLTADAYRLRGAKLPAPIVDAPRGRAHDCPAELIDRGHSAISWLTVEELLLYDWEYALQHRSEPAGYWLVPLLDSLYQLRPPSDYRISFWAMV